MNGPCLDRLQRPMTPKGFYYLDYSESSLVGFLNNRQQLRAQLRTARTRHIANLEVRRRKQCIIFLSNAQFLIIEKEATSRAAASVQRALESFKMETDRHPLTDIMAIYRTP
jgi:hypothetical protein